MNYISIDKNEIHKTKLKCLGTASTQQLECSSRSELLLSYQSFINQRVGLFEVFRYFSDEKKNIELYFTLKYEGSKCKCGREVVQNYVQVKPKRFRCRSCHTLIFPFSDTIFRNSEIPLSYILPTIFVLCNGSNFSSTVAADYLGCTYKTAHQITMRLRKLLYNGNTDKFRGVVEIDEAFLGTGAKQYRWANICTSKQLIIGIIERGSKKVRLFLAPDRKSKTIAEIILNNVEVGSTIYTDSWRGYAAIGKFYDHHSVDHSKREWVRGDVHTNSIESVWRHLKRNLKKAHIKVSDKYIQEYVDEACWRHNSKGKTSLQLFDNLFRRTFFSSLD